VKKPLSWWLVGGNVGARCLLAHIPAALWFGEALQQGLDTAFAGRASSRWKALLEELRPKTDGTLHRSRKLYCFYYIGTKRCTRHRD
jgi:hypothetical protein